ncbi:hypothetical protein [Calidifontibacter terrae]
MAELELLRADHEQAVLDFEIAKSRHQVSRIRAAVSTANAASARVLLKVGFRPVGPAALQDLGGKHGTWYELALTPGD